MKAQDIYRYAKSYKKVKSRQILDALYTHFTSWEQLENFKPHLLTPRGDVLTFQNDPALIVGVARFQGQEVAIIAQQTPPAESQQAAFNYGLVQADGYGLALCMMQYAEHHGLTLHTFIDTVGGDPFEDSATKLQSWLIARCQAKMLCLQMPSISTIIGQGGSGGAIALQLAHRRLMLALSTYAVITPEGCAAILFRRVNDETIATSLDILQPTAEHMFRYGIIDAIIAEPAPDEPDYQAQVLWHLENGLYHAMAEITDQAIEDLQYDLRQRIARCGHLSALPYRCEEHTEYQTKRLRANASALSPTPTTDYHIASIRRYVFGHSDVTPQACNTVKDSDGYITRHGCGHLFSEEAFRLNWRACPQCHRPDPLDPLTYIDLLLEPDSFRELYAHVKLEHIEGWDRLHDYSATRGKAETKATGTEALIVGYGTMAKDLHVAVAVSDFAYMGGSMGAVVGEKFCAIVRFACEHQLPLIAVSTTGGARMQEGTMALVQMAKTTAAVLALREAALPYVSVLGHPTVGGVFASYATLGDIIIAEEKATLSFAGDRVVKLTSGGRGFSPACMTAEFYAHHGGLHAVVKRQEMKALIAGILRMTRWYSNIKADYVMGRLCHQLASDCKQCA